MASPSQIRLVADKARDRHAQGGEEGLIEDILGALGVGDGLAVEFGAWDGTHFSNTAFLRERGFRTVLIEGERDRFEALKARFGALPHVFPIHAFVEPTGPRSVDALVGGALPGVEIDILSVDIDGDDLHILEGLAARPKLIVVEFNQTIPPPARFVNPKGANQGSSLQSFADWAGRAGYAIVAATNTNVFLVRRDLAAPFVELDPFQAYPWASARFLVSTYDGRNHVLDGTGRPVAQPVNPWDVLPSAEIYDPPAGLVGFADPKKRFWRSAWLKATKPFAMARARARLRAERRAPGRG